MELDSLPFSERPDLSKMICTFLSHTDPVLTIKRCIQAVMAASVSGGSAFAERAVEEFVAAHDGPDQQMGALRVLDQELISLLSSTSGEDFNVANGLIEYVDARMHTLRVSQKR